MTPDQAAATSLAGAPGPAGPRREQPARAGRVLLLSPSRGLGGGIERYMDTLESSFALLGMRCQRLDLPSAGAREHLRLLAAGRAALRSSPRPARLVVGHRALLPVAAALAREAAADGLSVLCHGIEAWGTRLRLRRLVEGGLMGRDGVRVVAVSSFTAGTLARRARAVVLHPGLSHAWYDTLTAAASAAAPPRAAHGITLVTAFRLESWREKGLGELVAAAAALGRGDLRLVVCGTGKPPADLIRLTGRHRWCTLRAGLPDHELARQFAVADLFVLATRTSPGRRASGEGFGLVLLESQVAGTPVVGPASGGSSDAFIEGVTGFAPTEESVPALSRLLARALADPGRLARMGERAGEWSRERFAPERYAQLVARRLL